MMHGLMMKKSVYIRDYSVHGYLKKKNGDESQMTAGQSKTFGLPHYSQEFYYGVITPDDVNEASADIKKKYEEGSFLLYDYYTIPSGYDREDSNLLVKCEI